MVALPAVAWLKQRGLVAHRHVSLARAFSPPRSRRPLAGRARQPVAARLALSLPRPGEMGRDP